MANPKPSQEPDGPALEKPSHAYGRNLGAVAGSKAGWENLSVFERAHRAGKLVNKELCKNEESTKVEAQKALDRYQAGDRFVEGWIVANAGNWPSGSDLSRIRAVGCPGSFVDFQIDVKNFMRALEGLLGTRDWMILRRVCGENFAIAETVTEISPGYRYSTLARFREALDALVDVTPAALRQCHGA